MSDKRESDSDKALTWMNANISKIGNYTVFTRSVTQDNLLRALRQVRAEERETCARIVARNPEYPGARLAEIIRSRSNHKLTTIPAAEPPTIQPQPCAFLPPPPPEEVSA